MGVAGAFAKAEEAPAFKFMNDVVLAPCSCRRKSLSGHRRALGVQQAPSRRAQEVRGGVAGARVLGAAWWLIPVPMRPRLASYLHLSPPLPTGAMRRLRSLHKHGS